MYDAERKHTRNDRFRRYFQEVLTKRETAAELRLFDSSTFFLFRWECAWRERENDILSAYKRNAVYNTAGGVCEWLGYAGVIFLITHAALSGQATIGDLAAVFHFASNFQRFLEGASHTLRDLFENSNFLGDIFEFFKITKENQITTQNTIEQVQTCRLLPKHNRSKIRKRNGANTKVGLSIIAKNITFAYPSATTSAIKNVSIKIKSGEKIAIVGENGAGKTTLVKLLMGLLQPNSGFVRAVDPLRGHMSIQEVYDGSAAIFQDYATFDLTLRENIGMSRLDVMDNDHLLTVAARQTDILKIFDRLSQGWDSYLGKMFGEDDLSKGQWQRIALSRAMFRDAGLIVLDEPTAALDPKAELALFEKFTALVKGRTAIMISHRLGTARLADRIIVLANGQVVESGRHEELMVQGNEYARLFSTQAKWYQ